MLVSSENNHGLGCFKSYCMEPQGFYTHVGWVINQLEGFSKFSSATFSFKKRSKENRLVAK